MRAFPLIVVVLVAGLALAACDDEPQAVEAVPPQEPGPEAIGHYCGMIVADHAGPKGQIFLDDRQSPIWFSSVRDTLAFTMLPEEPKNVAAIYVNDMAKATDWVQPEAGTWIPARDAVFVAGSDARGGMGAAEIVPFGDKAAAERFRAQRGGQIYAFGEVPAAYVLGPSEAPAGAAPAAESHKGH